MIELQEKIVRYVVTLFEEHADARLVYHNLSHTELVVAHSKQLIDYYQLSEEENFIIQTAAWFHDTGHLFNKTLGHEEAGVALMRKFLVPLNCSSTSLDTIADCIMSTKMPCNPLHLKDQIMCDADTWHLGTEDFEVMNDKVRQELYLREGIEMENWIHHSLKFLKNHRYYTSYCKEKLIPGKIRNMKLLESKMDVVSK